MKYDKCSKVALFVGMVLLVVVAVASCAPQLAPAPASADETVTIPAAGAVKEISEEEVASDIDSLDDLEAFDEELSQEISFENVDQLLK